MGVCRRRASRSKAGDATTTTFGPIPASARFRPSTRPVYRRNGTKALSYKVAPRLGPLLRLFMMATARL